MTVFYTQVSCKSSSQEFFDRKNNWGLINAIIGVYICISFWLSINHAANKLKIDDKLNDYQLVKLTEYTVCGHISKDFYHEVIAQTEPEPIGEEELTKDEARERVPIQRFARYFMNETKRQLGGEQYRVADLIFTFNNGEMLQLLRKRAQYLSDAKFHKAQSVESKMTELKQEKFDQLVVPIYFYCTFMEDFGQQEAVNRG